MLNLSGPIEFSSDIRGLRILLDRINEAARQYQFPLVAFDEEAAGKLAAQAGAGALERLAPKIDEVRLTEL